MSVVAITIGSTDVTADVLFETCRFESSVNGVGGPCSMRIRDLDRSQSYTPGQTIVLTIDGTVEWRGFVGTVNRIYVFPALNVTDFGLARFIDITGVDVNILLTKRIVFKQSNGADITAPLLPAHTADNSAIATLVADWLDLSGDGLDTSSLVENVGDTTWSQPGRAWEGSDTFGQALQSIASLPAAIYYIDPDLNLVYTDVDTPNAAFGLSDQPNGTTVFGYREMEVLKDGTGLANDVLAWGLGYGSNQPVFDRETDSASQTEHGVWQMPSVNFGVYKQDTLDRIAQSIIDGSPQSKRGAKDDRVAVTCTTLQPGLRVAQKVDFTSATFGFNDVIPIRKMVIDFPEPSTPRYALTLSHEIDTPFSFIDNFMFNWKFHQPNFGFCIPPMVLGPNGTCILPPSPPGPPFCPPAVCGITDSFNRTDPTSIGTADCGIVYTGSPLDWTVTPGVATVTDHGHGFPSADLTFSGAAAVSDIYWTAQVTASGPPDVGDIIFFGADTVPDFAEIDFSTDGTLEFYTNAPGSVFVSMPFGPDSLFKVRLNANGANARCKVWLATDPEPSSWTAETPFDVPATVFDLDLYFGPGSRSNIDLTIEVSLLDAPGLNRCSGAQIDTYQRVESSGWGDASNGNPWIITGGSAPATVDTAVSLNALFILDAGSANFKTARGGSIIALLGVGVPVVFSSGTVDYYWDLYATLPITDAGPPTHPAAYTQAQPLLSWTSDLSTGMQATVKFKDDGSAELSAAFTDSNGDSSGTSTASLGATVTDRWMRLHVQIGPAGLRAVLYPREIAEPAFQVTQASVFDAQMVADFGSGQDLTAGLIGSAASGRASISDPDRDQYLLVDNVNLAYPGSPCYFVLGTNCPFTDDFVRAADTNWNGDGNPWGYTWAFINPSGTVGITTGNIDGEHAHAVSVSGASSMLGIQNLDRYFLQCGTTPPLPLVIRSRFTPDYGFADLPDPPHPAGKTALSFAIPLIIAQPLANSSGANISAFVYHTKFWDDPTDIEGTFLRITSTFGDAAEVAVTVDADTTYEIELIVTATNATAILWNGDGTLQDQAAITLGGTPSVASQIGFEVSAQAIFYSSSPGVGFGPADISTDTAIDWVSYTDRPPCYTYIGGPTPTSLPPLNGYVTDNLISDGTTAASTSKAFLPNSTLVSVGPPAGPLLALARGTGYTENPSTNSITLASAPTAGDTIRISYWSQSGSPGGGGASVTVSSIAALMTALADNANSDIELTDDTYTVDVAEAQTTNSLFIGSAFAGRTIPVRVHPTTPGGVIFEGIGNYGLFFGEGAHHQTWDGFNFANMQGGIIGIGGFTPTAPPHDITLINITFESTCHRSSPGSNQEHGIYLANSTPRGPYNILIENLTVDGSNLTTCVWAAIHGFHGDSTNPAPDNVTIRNLVVTGCIRPVVMWYDTPGSNMRDWTIDGATITGADEYAVQFESVGASNIVIRNVTTTGSGTAGFFSSLGSYPSSVPGVTFSGDSFN